MLIYAVDDEKLALGLVEDVVAETIPDCVFTPFSSGSAYLAAMREKPADIVLLDVEMPGMTGIELAEQTLAIAENANVIFLTGYSQYKGDAMDVFASGYILKPITKEKLEKQLHHLRHPVKVSEGARLSVDEKLIIRIEEKEVRFKRRKTAELFWYLFLLNGRRAEAREIRCALFGRVNGLDVRTNSYFHHLKADLKQSLVEIGAGDVFFGDDREYALKSECFDCSPSREAVCSAAMEYFHFVMK